MIVIPSLEMPYSAREPSIVAVFIERTRPATMQKIITLAERVADERVECLGVEAETSAPSATACVSRTPPRPSGTSAKTATQKSADARSARGVSLWVSWNSGAKVATTSIPYADQHMKYSQVITSAMPPPVPMFHWKFELVPVARDVREEHQHEDGMQSSAPVR